ncbi:SRPBCC family protein [Streptomyces sp. NPDC056983]|uniref:SRPBCC family protein n=1 Tax=Streptomyces sp. NPDC056983 TaxID=3345987 RepID=UPI00362770B2
MVDVELTNTFTVNLPVEDAWKVLTDLERVAPCLPGAALLSVDGDVHRGAVKIKVGPVSARYEGTARFVERDDQAHRATVRAEGKDVGGQGSAAATVALALSEQGPGTQVDVRTDLELSGRVAQFGRGVIADVTNKLLQQFVQRLEAEFGSQAGVSGEPREVSRPAEVDSFDMIAGVGGPLAKRALPVAGVLAALIAGYLMSRGRRRNPVGQLPVVVQLTLPTPHLGYGRDQAVR